MPRLTGLELARQLRQTPFSGKILVLSAHLSPENRAAYDALHVDGMIPKPFDLHHLRAVVSRIARGEVPFTAADPNPFQLSPIDVHRMLKMALPESEKSNEST
jgi:DNA-binding NarL/FixJ family response regulator